MSLRQEVDFVLLTKSTSQASHGVYMDQTGNYPPFPPKSSYAGDSSFESGVKGGGIPKLLPGCSARSAHLMAGPCVPVAAPLDPE